MPVTSSTDIEKIVYSWLKKHNVEFSFQTSVTGGFGQQIGDATVDFVLLDRNIALRVMGGYWHEGQSKRGIDTVQKERLRSLGFEVVDLWEDDIKQRLDTVMKAAIAGQELR